MSDVNKLTNDHLANCCIEAILVDQEYWDEPFKNCLREAARRLRLMDGPFKNCLQEAARRLRMADEPVDIATVLGIAAMTKMQDTFKEVEGNLFLPKGFGWGKALEVSTEDAGYIIKALGLKVKV